MVKKVFITLLFIFMIGIFTGVGVLSGMLGATPDISTIEIKPQGFRTVVYDQGGNEINAFYTTNSNRIYIEYKDIPKQMVNAFVAVEDERFWKHNGIDYKGITRAIVKDILKGSMAEGASTITQQLVKNQVYDVGMKERTTFQKIERKVQEQRLAQELEQVYSKKELLEFYLNTIYLGQGVNGIEAAANIYFDKSAGELSVSEIACIAGITKNPYLYDPVTFPENNSKRRGIVLSKMLSLGYINQAEYDKAIAFNAYAKIKELHNQREEESRINSYYTDNLLRQLCKDFMEYYDISESEAYEKIYTGGYSVYSVQDNSIQKIVDSTINEESYYPNISVVSLDYRLTLLDPNGEEAIFYGIDDMLDYYRRIKGNPNYNNLYPTEESARIAANAYRDALIEDTGMTLISEEFIPTVQPQASFVVMDQKTGYVKAVEGGRGEKTDNLGFDRASDGIRQPGYTFNVLAAYLPYMDTTGKRLSPDDKSGTLNEAIKEASASCAMRTISEVTPDVAYEYLLKEGFTTLVEKETSGGEVFSDIRPETAVGGLTYGVTNMEITAAYAGIANQGNYIKPVFYSKVLDHDGNVIIDNTDVKDRSHRICKRKTAEALVEAMEGVVNSGAGRKAKMTTGIKCAGNTCAESSDYDLWFCGMTPYYTASVWVGFDLYMPVDMDNYEIMWRDVMDQIALVEGQSRDADWNR